METGSHNGLLPVLQLPTFNSSPSTVISRGSIVWGWQHGHWNQTAWVWILPPPLTKYVTLKINILLFGLLWKLSELYCCLAYGKSSVFIAIVIVIILVASASSVPLEHTSSLLYSLYHCPSPGHHYFSPDMEIAASSVASRFPWDCPLSHSGPRMLPLNHESDHVIFTHQWLSTVPRMKSKLTDITQGLSWFSPFLPLTASAFAATAFAFHVSASWAFLSSPNGFYIFWDLLLGCHPQLLCKINSSASFKSQLSSHSFWDAVPDSPSTIRSPCSHKPVPPWHSTEHTVLSHIFASPDSELLQGRL